MEGWIKLHRQILESEVFASQIGLKIWVWCLLKANYSDKYVPIIIGRGESVVKVNRGSFLFGRFKAENELNIDGSTIYKWIKKFENDGMIEIQSNSHYSIITICKYDDYQQREESEVTAIQQPLSSHSTAIQQPCNTTKNNKKEKENINVREIFETFRKEYPGTKRGLDIELKYFLSKTKPETVELLLPALNKEKEHRNKLSAVGEFIPHWKHLKTWINNECWSQEFPAIIPNQSHNGKPIKQLTPTAPKDLTGLWE